MLVGVLVQTIVRIGGGGPQIPIYELKKKKAELSPTPLKKDTGTGLKFQ